MEIGLPDDIRVLRGDLTIDGSPRLELPHRLAMLNRRTYGYATDIKAPTVVRM